MKQIVMLQGMGNNERGWARLVSKFGRVVLIQQGMIQHVEIWEGEQLVFDGPETTVMSTRFLDEATLSSLTLCRSLARVREHCDASEIDVVISTNYSMGMAGLVLRAIGRARKSVVVLSDYLPPRGSIAVRFHRRMASALTRFVARWSDEVWSVSPRIPAASIHPSSHIVPICINDNQVPIGERREIGYVGFPSADHALDLLFEISRKHGFKVNIIGASPYLETIKSLAPPHTEFHGVMNDQDRINRILANCFCGYAVYRNTGPQSYSYYGVPSKTFYFLASNTPVVTTDTAHFSKTLQDRGVGKLVDPTRESIESGILEIRDRFAEFYNAILRFRTEWNRDCETFHRDRLKALSADVIKANHSAASASL